MTSLALGLALAGLTLLSERLSFFTPGIEKRKVNGNPLRVDAGQPES